MSREEDRRSGMLYLVATPIGNLEDISLRASRILAEVDLIAAEDTRNTRKLLSHLGLSKEMLSYHEHNRHSSGERILQKLREGYRVALVSDAGMPCISDPGQELVAMLHRERIPVTVIPGPSAALAALSVSGLANGRFAFEGFLPVKGQERHHRLAQLQGEERTMILYESPHRILKTLDDLIGVLGSEREAVLVRELTKLHEEIRPATLGELAQHYRQQEARGECVLVVGGAESLEPPQSDAEAALNSYAALVASGMDRRMALKEAARRSGIGRDALYQLLVARADKGDEGCS